MNGEQIVHNTIEHHVASETTKKTIPWLIFDIFELVSKNSEELYPFSSQILRAGNRSEFLQVRSMHKIRKLANCKRKKQRGSDLS